MESKTHTLKLQPVYFDLIKKGIKTLEGRLNDEKHQLFNIGDKITFLKEPEMEESVQALILDKYIFKNFNEMAQSLDKSELGFASVSKEAMIEVYRNFYPREKEDKYGVVIFKIQVIWYGKIG